MISLEVKKSHLTIGYSFVQYHFVPHSIYQTHNATEIKYVQLGPKNVFEIKSKTAMLLQPVLYPRIKWLKNVGTEALGVFKSFYMPS